MIMPVLEYQSPCNRPKVDWGDRYWRFVPKFALAYVPFLIFYVLVSLALESGEGRHTEPFYYCALERAALFPAIFALAPLFGCFALLIGGGVNALLWGVAIVGVWHLASFAIMKLRSVWADNR